MAISEAHAVGGLESWLRQSLSSHIYADLVPQIPGPVMRRLGFAGLRLVGLYILVALCAPPIINLTVAAMKGGIAGFEFPLLEMALYAVLVLCFARHIIRKPAEQELLYRRTQGKWRWDQ